VGARGGPPARRISPYILVFILTGAVLLLALLGGGAGVAAFLLLRAGYGFLVWGLLPPLALILAAAILGAGLWWAAGSFRHNTGEGSAKDPGRGG
jgi:hypothetical protein